MAGLKSAPFGHTKVRRRIYLDAIKQIHIPHWAVEFTRKNAVELNGLRRAIFNANTECVRGDDFRVTGFMDCMPGFDGAEATAASSHRPSFPVF